MAQARPPTGTVTFLFTDIEGSTKLWEAHPEEMRIALARHDALVREAVSGAGGYVFKTAGDAFFAAFATAPEAVAAALSAQLGLASEPWTEETRIKARMALHTGTVESRDSDYFGRPLNHAARLLATGHGGQTLLSRTTYDLVWDSLPVGAGLLDLGEHRLKDLGRPEAVYQLLNPNLPSDFPPLRSLDNPRLRHNLPAQLTSFVGRERELDEISTLSTKTRLLTLTGSGGCGKTRLALQAAADLVDASNDGVWLVELAPLTYPAMVVQTIAGVLGLKEEHGKPISQTLIEHLEQRHLVLVLDNCEHLLDACASLADTLLRSCPRVLVLATSREGLGIAGETTYRVPSLSVPDLERKQTAEGLTLYESVRLFIDRAVQAQTDFQVTNRNAPALASVCYHLDGIPLAIELAAARVRSLSIEDIDRKLDQRFRLLTGGSRTALPRQRTLRSLIDWSYLLLSANEKRLLGRLSVFAGGWNLEAAEQVCAGEGVESDEVLDLLTSLVDKSLAVPDASVGGTRYRLLETVRQYARDRLLEGGEDEPWRGRHLAHFLALAEEAEPQLTGPDQAEWLTRLEAEHDNLRAAIAWCRTEEGGPEAGLRLAGALWRFWFMRGYLSMGRDCLAGAMARDGAACRTASRAKALNGAGNLAVDQGDNAAAKRMYEESLSIRRELGDMRGVASSLSNLGLMVLRQGDNTAARPLYEESLSIFRELGDKWGIALLVNNLGSLAWRQGDHKAAGEQFEESLSLFRELGDKSNTALALNDLGLMASDRGDFRAARAMHEESLSIHRELGDKNRIAETLEGLGNLALAEGRPEQGGRLLGAAGALREAIDYRMPSDQVGRHDENVAAALDALGREALDRAWEEGREMTMDQAIDLALDAAGG